jgi:FixJ family two-component response regulator
MNPSPIGYLLADDLMFTSRITATARAQGLDLATCRNSAELLRRAAERPPACVLLDLHLDGVKIEELVSALKQTGSPFIVGYGSHVRSDVLRQARTAGCALVLPRSQFVAELETSLPAWFAGPKVK